MPWSSNNLLTRSRGTQWSPFDHVMYQTSNCVISRLDITLVAQEKLDLNHVIMILSFNVIHTLKSKHTNQLSVEIAREIGTRSVTYPQCQFNAGSFTFLPREIMEIMIFHLLFECTADFISLFILKK